jgi:hypothetical protein
MSNKSTATVATMGIDIGKNSFHVIGLDHRNAIGLRQKWSRGQVEARLANMPPCLTKTGAVEQGEPSRLQARLSSRRLRRPQSFWSQYGGCAVILVGFG